LPRKAAAQVAILNLLPAVGEAAMMALVAALAGLVIWRPAWDLPRDAPLPFILLPLFAGGAHRAVAPAPVLVACFL